jgi:hypothetical protein
MIIRSQKKGRVSGLDADIRYSCIVKKVNIVQVFDIYHGCRRRIPGANNSFFFRVPWEFPKNLLLAELLVPVGKNASRGGAYILWL